MNQVWLVLVGLLTHALTPDGFALKVVFASKRFRLPQKSFARLPQDPMSVHFYLYALGIR